MSCRLGGLLAAYDLSKALGPWLFALQKQEKDLLDLADQLGRRILTVVNARGVTPYTFGGGRGGPPSL